jgi:hypothetical protein
MSFDGQGECEKHAWFERFRSPGARAYRYTPTRWRSNVHPELHSPEAVISGQGAMDFRHALCRRLFAAPKFIVKYPRFSTAEDAKG